MGGGSKIDCDATLILAVVRKAQSEDQVNKAATIKEQPRGRDGKGKTVTLRRELVRRVPRATWRSTVSQTLDRAAERLFPSESEAFKPCPANSQAGDRSLVLQARDLLGTLLEVGVVGVSHR